MELTIKEIPIRDKVLIMGHSFHGLEEIKACVEISCYKHDLTHDHPFNIKAGHKKINGIHIAEMWAPYPCFDSSDSLHENRTFRNYFFSREPFTETRLREIFGSCHQRMNFCLVNDAMPDSCAPALYYEGEGEKMVFALRENKENKTHSSVYGKFINQLKKIFLSVGTN